MKKRKFRKGIRIDGKLVQREFTNAESANAWYSQLHTKKVYSEFGIAPPTAKDGPLFKEFALGEFMDWRRANYPESTWRSDEQRLEDHVLPAIGHIPLAKINVGVVRALLAALTEKKRLSSKTRDRVQALISVIYSAAINRDAGPLVKTNPTFGITFRQGKRKAATGLSYLHTHADCRKYIKAARALGPLHYGVACLGLMAGLRKQEMIAMRFGRIDTETHMLEVSEKYIQAAHSFERGTKSGEGDCRYVPMSEELEAAMLWIRSTAVKNGDRDFVLQYRDGRPLSPRTVTTLNRQTCSRANVECTVHGLRHTFGREFAQHSGNMGALKDIMGHSNLAVTQIYSSLGKDRLKGFRSVLNYGASAPDNDN